ncbi:gamma-glutamyltransferase family protein [Acetobacteraceae bacterium KSS8]|uniref:Gamma-glutamyltransferase family protein n=1 Tax=Endosaccharibacter trunci TaxID=2812733 RepID=A0ABT1W662_9PROT|nr:gamma-glutamyltransferase family protein [Acetobacteraceae bacterium KSS8]
MPKPVAASSPVCSATRRAIRTPFARLLLSGAVALPLALSGCGSVQSVRNLVAGPPSPYLSGYIGSVVADEPVAALAGRDVLARGGNAADAAAATGLALAVTLPSRASLGGGGACLAYRAGDKAPQAFLFTPVAGTDPTGPGGRPASVPMTARGLFLMQARYGSVSFDDLVKPAARLARSGITVSRALANDLEAVRGPLFADQQVAAIFARPDGSPVQAGDQLTQADLAATLDRLAIAGVGDLYTGLLWRAYADGVAQARGGVSASDIHNAIPGGGAPLVVNAGNDRVAFLPPPADGGLGAAAAFGALQNGGSAAGVAGATVAAWRASHPSGSGNADLAEEAQSFLSGTTAGGAALGRLPASTSFTVVDRKGGAVACALTMDNLFGTGRVAGTTGIILGASPARLPPPLLAASIAWNPSAGTLRAAVAGSGQNQAAEAVAEATNNVLHDQPPAPVTETGRVNAIACPRGAEHCTATTDPRGDGLATRSN